MNQHSRCRFAGRGWRAGLASIRAGIHGGDARGATFGKLALALGLAGIGMVPPASAAAPDIWRVMPAAQPATALPGDVQPWSDACGVDAVVPAPLTLGQAVALALCGNPQARQAWFSVIAASAQIGQAKAAYLPTLSGNVSRSSDTVTTHTAAGTSSNHFAVNGRNLGASWLLFDFGARAANVSYAEQNVAAALASRDALLQQLIAAVGQAYIEAGANAASVRAATLAESAASDSLGAARGRMNLGVATIVDVLQAQTALSQATLLRVRAQGNARTAAGTLAYAMGRDPGSRIELAADPSMDAAGAAPEDATNDTPAGPMSAPNTGAHAVPTAPIARPDADLRRATDAMRDIDALMAEAVATHPSLRAGRAQLAAAQARADAVAADGYPSVSITGGQYRNGRPGTAFTSSQTTERLVAITVSVPLFEGFSRGYKQREQQALVAAKSVDLDSARLQVELEVWRNYQALQSEAAGVDAARDLVASAAEALKATRLRYRVGTADIVSLLTAQKDDGNARQEGIQSLANWRIARLKLISSLGQSGYWALQMPESP